MSVLYREREPQPPGRRRACARASWTRGDRRRLVVAFLLVSGSRPAPETAGLIDRIGDDDTTVRARARPRSTGTCHLMTTTTHGVRLALFQVAYMDRMLQQKGAHTALHLASYSLASHL